MQRERKRPLGTNWSADQLGWGFSVIFPFVFNHIDSSNILSAGETVLRLRNPKSHVVCPSADLSFRVSDHPQFRRDGQALHWVHPPLPPHIHTFWSTKMCDIVLLDLEALVYVAGYLIRAPRCEYCCSNLYFNFSPAVQLAETQMGSRAVGNQKN